MNPVLKATPPDRWRCALGHTQQAHECPACGEVATGEKATLEHWRWYRGRTSSKRVKALVDEHLKSVTT